MLLTHNRYPLSLYAVAFMQGLIEFFGGAGTDNLLDQNAYFPASFINLSASTGPNSVGSTLEEFGGSGVDSGQADVTGWSFELVFRPGLQATWGKLMDIGATRPGGITGPATGDIVFGWASNTPYQSFQVFNAEGATFTSQNIAPVQAGQWYHSVLVFQWVGGLNYTLANYQIYWQGNLTATYSLSYGVDFTPRQNANLALSAWGDAQWSGLLDTFNIYAEALSQEQVAALYTTAMGPNPFCDTPYTSAAIQPDAVWFDLDFAQDPRVNASDTATYSWVAVDPTDTALDQQSHQVRHSPCNHCCHQLLSILAAPFVDLSAHILC